MKLPDVLTVGDAIAPDAVAYIAAAPGVSESQQQELIDVIRERAGVTMLTIGDHQISREDDFRGRRLASVVAKGSDLMGDLPWLRDYYRGPLQEIASAYLRRQVVCLEDPDEAAAGNVVGKYMRFETHVDNYPVGANLYLQPGSDGSAGDLVIGEAEDRTFRDVLNSRIAAIAPYAGTLSLVSFQAVPHTVDVVGRKENTDAGHTVTYEKYLDRLYNELVFGEPDLDDPKFWKFARIAVNFNFSTPQFVEQLRSGQASTDVNARMYAGE